MVGSKKIYTKAQSGFFCRSKGHGFIDDDTAMAVADAKVGHKTCTSVCCPCAINILMNIYLLKCLTATGVPIY